MVYIECKSILQYLTILWKSRWVGGSLKLEILMGGEAQAILEFQVEGVGGKRAFRREGVNFFQE